jgi:hypothetical protein
MPLTASNVFISMVFPLLRLRGAGGP